MSDQGRGNPRRIASAKPQQKQSGQCEKDDQRQHYQP
jgi:hypothetical protein